MVRANDIAIETRCLRKFLRMVIGTWTMYELVLHGAMAPTIAWPAACVCMADMLQPFRMCMHEELPSLELLLR